MITANTLEKNINNSEETSKLVNPILYREIYQDLSSIAASWSEEEKNFYGSSLKQTIPKLKTINEEELASFINEADPLAMGILVKSDTFNNIRKSRLKLDIEELMESKENISDEDFEKFNHLMDNFEGYLGDNNLFESLESDLKDLIISYYPELSYMSSPQENHNLFEEMFNNSKLDKNEQELLESLYLEHGDDFFAHLPIEIAEKLLGNDNETNQEELDDKIDEKITSIRLQLNDFSEQFAQEYGAQELVMVAKLNQSISAKLVKDYSDRKITWEDYRSVLESASQKIQASTNENLKAYIEGFIGLVDSNKNSITSLNGQRLFEFATSF